MIMMPLVLLRLYLSSLFAPRRWAAGVALRPLITDDGRQLPVATGAAAGLLLGCLARRAVRVLRKQARQTMTTKSPPERTKCNRLVSKHWLRHWNWRWRTLKRATVGRARARSAGRATARTSWTMFCCWGPTVKPQRRRRPLPPPPRCCCIHRAAETQTRTSRFLRGSGEKEKSVSTHKISTSF